MKTLSGFCVVLLAAAGAFAQNRSGFVSTPTITRNPPSVVFPGGTSATPGIQRTAGSVVYPAGGGLQIGIPGSPFVRPNTGRPMFNNNRRATGVGYAYPIYVGGYGGYSDVAPVEPASAPVQPITIIYPPAPAPVIINHYGSSEMQPSGPTSRIFEPAPAQTQDSQQEAEHYLIAFKDHSIYSAVAYWVDGDTLHYFTAGNTHNQASVDLVDRELTAKINQGSGHEVKLPAAR